MTDNQEWIAALKVGDKVAVEYYIRHTKHYYTTKVKHISAREIITETDLVFDKTGKHRESVGKGFKYIVPVTDEVLDHLTRQKLLDNISKFKWEQLNTEQLQRIVDIVSE